MPVTLHAAQLLLSRGLTAEAVEAYREFLVRFPQNHGAQESLGYLLRRLGREDESVAVLREAARIEAVKYGSDADVQRFLAAADRSAEPPDKAPPVFITKLYEDFAPRFEPLLVNELGYRGPEILLDAVTRVIGADTCGLNVIDLGCGTGLAGVAFSPRARRLSGVDLSESMIALAAAKGVYDELAVGDVVEHLKQLRNPVDLVLAADVFVYLGDLAPVFAAARTALRPGGWLAFTVESGTQDGDAYLLQAVRRYAHPRGYLLHAAAEAGLETLLIEECSTRREATLPVRSFVAVMSTPLEI